MAPNATVTATNTVDELEEESSFVNASPKSVVIVLAVVVVVVISSVVSLLDVVNNSVLDGVVDFM